MKRILTLITAGSLAVIMVITPVVAVRAQSQGDARRAEAEQRVAQTREAVETRVEEIKKDVEARRTQIKQDVCERRQSHIQAVIPQLATGTTAVKNAFDKVYERVQTFYTSGQLTVANYEQLKAAVDAAQADAAAAVEAANQFKFELDCNNPSVGDQLAGFRESVKEAKEALKTYRAELVKLISAMRAAAAEQNAQADSENEGTSNEQ